MHRAIGMALALLLLSTPAMAKEKTMAQTNPKVCQNLSELHASISALDNLNEKSTLGQVRAARERLDKAAEQVRMEAATAKNTKAAKDLHLAVSKLDSKIASLPNSMTIAQARKTIKPQVSEVKKAWSELQRTSGCRAT